MSRCYPNNLKPIPLDSPSARDAAITKLQNLICTTLPLLLENAASSSSDNTVYTGSAGIVLTLLRLGDHEFPLPNSINLKSAIDQLLKLHPLPHAPTSFKHLSPIGSITGPALVTILAQLSLGSEPDRVAVQIMRRATRAAIKLGGEEGNDEVLYGRAGLLWALMTLRRREVELGFDIDDAIQKLVAGIIESGQSGSRRYGVEGMMWEWHDKSYLGAIHGTAGILTILFQLPAVILRSYMPSLIATLTSLCHITTANHGHLPSSLPIHHRSHPYVQICHGSPGLLLCLNTLRQLHPQMWSKNPFFASTLRLAAEAVWEGGVVKKGLGICHGVAGNAWSLLMMAELDGEDDDVWMGRAVALLEIAGEMPPLGKDERFRIPDTEWSLFEGVAGTVAAWVEAWAVLKGGREKMVGFPGMSSVF